MMTIKTRLTYLAAIPVIGMLLAGVATLVLAHHTSRQLDAARNIYAREAELGHRLQLDVIQVQQFLTDYSATRGQDGLDHGLKEAAEYEHDFPLALDSYRQVDALDDSIDESTTLARLGTDFTNYYQVGHQMAEIYSRDGVTAGNKFMPNFDKASDALTEKLDPFIKTQAARFQGALADVQTNTRNAVRAATLTGLALLLATIGFSWRAIHSITRTIGHGVLSIQSATSQNLVVASHIKEASGHLAQGAATQAASIEQTSASLEEMSSMTRNNADNAQKVKDLARQTRDAVDLGTADLQAMNGAMETLKHSSTDIAKIIKTIDEIAFQTNILALNAAVEAARAGEAGMGFAVVADEVRNLAQRCAVAARETSAKIEDAIGKTAQGAGLSHKVSGILENIFVGVRQIDDLAGQLSSASREQTTGIAQINQAVGEMDKVTQNNAASAEESAAAAHELDAQTLVLKKSVDHLSRLVGGHLTEGTPGDSLAVTTSTATTTSTAPATSIRNSAGVISWNPETMSTHVPSVDEQHQALIRLINQVHADCLNGTAADNLMQKLELLGNYAGSHFAHEEETMAAHQCPMAAKNKAAHTKFLQQYQDILAEAKAHGPSSRLALQVKKLLGDWLSGHICKVDTSLRSCHEHAEPAHPATNGHAHARSRLEF